MKFFILMKYINRIINYIKHFINLLQKYITKTNLKNIMIQNY